MKIGPRLRYGFRWLVSLDEVGYYSAMTLSFGQGGWIHGSK
jgi:hypothetical protein